MMPYTVCPKPIARRTRWIIIAALLGWVSLFYFASAAACFIDGRALSVVEDIDNARAILSVRPSGKKTATLHGYQVLRVVKSDGVIQVGDAIEVPSTPRGLLERADKVLLFHHASGYWDVRPPGMLEKFVDAVLALPQAQGDDVEAWRQRLEFFLPYLDFMDITIAQGAEQEFSKAPYRAIALLKPLIDRERILKRMQNASYAAQRLQTTLTLLAVSGTAEDAALVEPLIDGLWRQNKIDSLGTILATYLELKGPEGLALIEQRYLRDRQRTIEEIKTALRALRFHLNEDTSRIPAEAALASMRILVQEQPRLIPLVVPDLIAKQDWQALPQIVQAFRDHSELSPWLRQSVSEYLNACPLVEAKAALQELALL